MKEINDGGPAFPNGHFAVEGMSLRDYFAAQVFCGAADSLTPERVAAVAYEYADAMLAQRNKKAST